MQLFKKPILRTFLLYFLGCLVYNAADAQVTEVKEVYIDSLATFSISFSKDTVMLGEPIIVNFDIQTNSQQKLYFSYQRIWTSPRIGGNPIAKIKGRHLNSNKIYELKDGISVRSGRVKMEELLPN